MPVREVSGVRTLADASAEAVTLIAGIVRRHERLQATDLSTPARRAIDDELADMNVHLCNLEAQCRRGEIRT